MSDTDVSSSTATWSAGIRSSSAWVCVWDPTVTSPVAMVSRIAAHDTGGAPYGNGRCSSMNAVARYIVTGILVAFEDRERDVGEVGRTVVERDDDRILGRRAPAQRAAPAHRSSVVTRPPAASSAICSSKRASGRSSSSPDPAPTRW